ncbi:GntR family transcriptional regulator [Spirilliplanes yamanashiensis]|uniref:Transcriptional regulator n=1 Tax=Spirilliplanes yamanashiensis TaxID=42233 RepID=A0A8J3YE83_9ACTN|nr:GntR family transcriptional regulator [Spirilliplanes yamanashiensis]MDP9816589.1 DNA-binding GntR family transcriptional regulator [Spirilliplanes yamanashiensis]GIJ06115.1 transcriptional regulator [Spirilliplanes yamanashiensis]
MNSYAVPPTRREAVVRQLREEIISGELPPGTLIKDAEIAARFGVSITPVREAIAQLSVEGLIDIAPNRTRHVTKVTQKNALELIDVMQVLACAGFEWGMDNLTETHLETMRQRQREFVEGIRSGNMVAATAAGADFSTVVILASGNRELQSMVDLVVARTTRILAQTAESDLWQIWIEGHDGVLAALEGGDTEGALRRYRQIYADYRAKVATLMFGA